MSETNINDNLFLIGGESATGKSASLQYLENHEGVLYLNFEAGKKLPFKNAFISKVITNPTDISKWFATAEKSEKIHTIVIDSSTFMMDMYESQYVLKVKDTMKGWSNYAQFWKEVMQVCIANSTKNVIVLAHTRSEINPNTQEMETSVPIKGASKNVGVEAYFSSVLATKKISTNKLTPYLENNKLLTITKRDEMLGFKHVYQTQLTKETVNERIRNPMDMWSFEETYIDNNAQYVLTRLREFYATE